MNHPASNQSSSSISPEKIQAQLERLLSSKQFSQTRSLDRFLKYAVLKTLEHEEADLKECLIGREVFHRGADYDPAKDAVVRVQAGALRKKLACYYAEEGLTDEIIIELPKGGYIPTFQLRHECPAEALALFAPEVTAESTALVWSELPTAIPPVPKAAKFSGRLAWQLAAAFLIGSGLTVLVTQKFRPAPPAKIVADAATDQALQPLWENFFAPDASTLLAYGTPQFFQFNGFYMRDVLVNSPQEIEAESGGRLNTVRKAFKTALDPIEVYTGVGEAHGINTLSRFFWLNDHELKIARSRLVGWQEVKNFNLIFLSSMRFHTLADQLNYPNDFVIKASGISGTITNLRPATGEQAEYATTGGESYAVITLWPGKAENRRILQLSGNTTWGTLAAAEYATDKEALHKLHEQLEQCRLKQGLQLHPPYFQVLVRAEVKDNQPVSLAYITHHDLDVRVQSNGAAQTASNLKSIPPSPTAPTDK